MNRLSSYIPAAAAILLCAAIFTGCRSSRSTRSSAAYPSTSAEQAPVEVSPLKSVTDNYRDWTDVSVPVTMRLVSPKNMSVSARARMVRGRCIDLSFRMLGFEVARIWLTPDSVVAASRPKKVYLAESLSKLTSGLPLNLDNLQDMLMGRPFMPGGSTLTLADSAAMRLDTSSGSVRLLPRRQHPMADYGYVLDLPSVVTALAVVAGDHDISFTASYSGPEPLTPAGNVMDNVAVDIDTPRGEYAAEVAWKWGSARWNDMITVDPPATAGLRRVTSAQLMKIIKEM
ncbi:MAG: DUF4292 domain-containing protein [Muribaculum sp.]|nr:DUF4292 domain-containing protein [Muribaculum sp.]